ncbi:MAG TPA: hypothetical protein VKE22_23475 [Haliangiales bacterium]|nr:hypothetical protein [Haliangiales bacterium]
MADPATLLRALKLARVPGKTVAEACARFGVSRGAYQKAKRDRRAELAWTDDELVLSGLVYFGGSADVADLVSFIDWINHSVYRAAEVRAILTRLRTEGLVRRRGRAFRLAREWP